MDYKKRKFFIGVTTYNRSDFLKRMLLSWDETRNRDIDWTLVVADDGSSDDTIEMFNNLSFDGVTKAVIQNNRVGVHRQTNQLINAALESGSEFCFKADDDVLFLESGWDESYYESAMRTGFHHLVMFDRNWFERHRGGITLLDLRENGLRADVNVQFAMGALFTFTPEVISKIGYFDEHGFGVCGWGHVDWSWRACRAGYNNEKTCFDIDHSEKYVQLINEDYRPAISREERMKAGNTSNQEMEKINTMRDGSRLYIPYPEDFENTELLKANLPRVGVILEHNKDKTVESVNNGCKVVVCVEPEEDLSNLDIVITDDPEVIAKAGIKKVAIIGYATDKVRDMVNHEKDGFIYLNNDWMIHWLSTLANNETREKVTSERYTIQLLAENGVTVVIPCYNQAKYLERCVGSIARQTKACHQVIIVDDGSPDDVPKEVETLVSRYPELNIKLIRQANKGLSGARNAGICAAQTGWVIPLDADDEISNQFIEFSKLSQWKNRSDVVYTNVKSDQYGFVPMNFEPGSLAKKNTIVCTCLIRKDLWEKVGGYDECMKLGFEDWEFWIRCVSAGARFSKADACALFFYHDEHQSMLSETRRRAPEIMAYMRAKHWKMFAAPRVTVVIPCYNQANYLERCLESVVCQTEKDIEIIVVDDGSPDDVSSEFARLKKKLNVNMRLVTKKNGGLPSARNAGFERARAEWVIPLDADDRLGQTDYIEKCFEKTTGDIGVVITDGLSVKGNKTNSRVDVVRLRKENTMHACQMIRRQVWRNLGGYNEVMKLGYEDWEFWVHCLEKGVSFAKATGIHLLIDDDHEGRMTPVVQEAKAYWKLLSTIESLHPNFFIDKKVADLTVILSSYNQRKELELVLESYKNQTMLPKEVIINDDGSTDGTLEYLDGLDDLPFELRYVTRQHSWYRLASGNNEAAKHAKGSRLLFTNGDQIHSPKSFESHAALPNSKVGGGVFKGISLGHSQKITKDMIADWSKVEEIQSQFPSGKNNVPHIQQTNPNVNPIGVWGGNFSVPTDTFERIGGYNEEYDVGWGGEENDLVKRSVQAGCQVDWVMNSEIFHLDHPIRAYAQSMLGSYKYIKELK